MKRYDLNLLLALDALLRERSVSAAARRIGIGQPAMSAALSRLRALFDDPLLVRGSDGMEPTARARQLAEPLRTTLEQLGAMIEPALPFDPARTKRTFRISGGDYAGMTILPRLTKQLLAAGGIDLRYRYLEKDSALAALDDDTIDLALLVMKDLPPRFGSEVLVEETFVGVARIDHPIFSGPIEPATFAAFDHLLITERGDAKGSIDTALALLGLTRRIAITVPSAALVADVLLGSDLVATIPRRAAERIVKAGEIAVFDPPVQTNGWTMNTVWSARNARDPALLWMRNELRNAAESTCGRLQTQEVRSVSKVIRRSFRDLET